MCLIVFVLGCSSSKDVATPTPPTGNLVIPTMEPVATSASPKPLKSQTVVPEPLPTSQLAPTFSASADEGELITLEATLKSNQYIVVLFYRGFF